MRNSERFLNAMTGVAAACAVIVTAIVVYRQVVESNTAASSPAPTRQRHRVVANWQEQVAAGRRMGSAEAPLTILYYGDFECPACRAFTDEVEKLRRAHPADVSVVFRHSPLGYHRFAYPSARAAECAANQGKFEPMYRALYAAQDSLGLVPFAELARRAAVPAMRLFESCMRDTASVARIERDREAAKEANIPGTPGILIGGTLYVERIPTAADLEQLVRATRAARN